MTEHVCTRQPCLIGSLRQRRCGLSQVVLVDLDPCAAGLHERAGLACELRDLRRSEFDIVEHGRPTDVGELLRTDDGFVGLTGEAKRRRRFLSFQLRDPDLEAARFERVTADGH